MRADAYAHRAEFKISAVSLRGQAGAGENTAGINLLRPDINMSVHSFTASGRAIRAGLALVRGDIAELEKLIRERVKGPFLGLMIFGAGSRRRRDNFGTAEPDPVRSLRRPPEKLAKAPACPGSPAPIRRRGGFPLETQKAAYVMALTGLTFTGHPTAYLREGLSQ
ncbi:helix-hairpin-helix domain-containing protein [Geobacter anodireducens]